MRSETNVDARLGSRREKGGRTKEKQKGGSSSLRSAKQQTRRLCRCKRGPPRRGEWQKEGTKRKRIRVWENNEGKCGTIGSRMMEKNRVKRRFWSLEDLSWLDG